MAYKLIIMALALSIDAFGIGLTYGVRGIKLSNAAKLIISFQAISITLIAMQFGAVLQEVFSPEISTKAGAVLLSLLGIWIILQSTKEKKEETQVVKPFKTKSIFLKHMGITIKIIRSPQTCDIDNSSTIDTFEAIYLGFALSIDAFAAIISVGMIEGFSLSMPLTLALTQVILLSIGSFCGIQIKSSYPVNPKIWMVTSGVLLIVIAVLSLNF